MCKDTSHLELIRYSDARLHLQTSLWQVWGRPRICIAYQSQDDLGADSSDEYPLKNAVLQGLLTGIPAQAYRLTIPGYRASEDSLWLRFLRSGSVALPACWVTVGTRGNRSLAVEWLMALKAAVTEWRFFSFHKSCFEIELECES